MKKSIALVAMAFGVTSAFAQDLTSKKGEPFLPEAGDYAIGVDATPFLQYVGNFFGKSTANAAPTWNFANSNFSITGKKFKDANNAYRASINVSLSSSGGKSMVNDRSVITPVTYPNLPSMVENKYSNRATTIGLSVGIEKRRGKTRLQGVYGAEAGLGITSSSSKYTYGNALSVSATNPVGVSVGGDGMNGGTNITADTYGNTARITKVKGGLGFQFGVRGFVGAEYFVAPKVSIGGEFGWGLGFGLTGKSKTSTESIGVAGTTASVGTQEIEGAKTSSFILGTDNKSAFFGPSGVIRLNLHF